MTEVTEPDWVWVDALRAALADLPYPVAVPEGEWEDLFLSDSALADGRTPYVAVTAVRGDLWVEVHSGPPGAVDVADRLAELGAEGSVGSQPAALVVDDVPVPATRWTTPDGWVAAVERDGFAHTVTVSGAPEASGASGTAAGHADGPDMGLMTVTDLDPLLDAYLRQLGWSTP